jgi:hypothetical protein
MDINTVTIGNHLKCIVLSVSLLSSNASSPLPWVGGIIGKQLGRKISDRVTLLLSVEVMEGEAIQR